MTNVMGRLHKGAVHAIELIEYEKIIRLKIRILGD